MSNSPRPPALLPMCCILSRFGYTDTRKVAGGLGERLGYDGIKLALPVEVRGEENSTCSPR